MTTDTNEDLKLPAEQRLRLECIRLAGGSIGAANSILQFVLGTNPKGGVQGELPPGEPASTGEPMEAWRVRS